MKTILICEDDFALRELMRAALGTAYRIVEAHNGNDALELARDVEPDLVILDLMLPGRSGAEVLASLQADAKTAATPVVVVTAWTHIDEDMLAAGASRFVRKPFDPDELRETVEELLHEQ
jgi:DNA-binding response OmpR family regulator